jgi:dihydroorotase
MSVDLVIHGGRVVTENGSIDADLAIADGLIVGIGAHMPPSRSRIDATGMHLLPGGIDVHVHFRDPGLEYKEDWGSGSRAAARGGVTTVFDMPNTIPPTATVEALALKHARAAEKSVVDYGIYALLDDSNIDDIETLATSGVIGFKLFLGNTTGNLPCPSDGAVLEGFEILARLGLRCTVHAENSPILFRREARLQAAGRTDVLAHLAARSDICAIESLNRIIVLAEWTGCRVHIAHESTRYSLPYIRAAKARGVDITVETCPQYLFLSTEDMLQPGGEVMRVNPPIREPENQTPLFDALLDGTIDMLATDHAPHTSAEKFHESIWECGCGFPGVETSMRLMLTEVNRGRMTIEHLAKITSANPARAFGLYPRKGVLQVGSDADIAVIDLHAHDRIRAENFFSRAKFSPFEGRAVQGVPVMTLVRGHVVMQGGKITAAPGWGRPVLQTMPAPVVRNADKTTASITAQR